MSTRDPYPLTWELPALVLGGLLLTVGAGVQLGRSMACWAAGSGWLWPDELVRSTGGILAGRPDAGLAPGACLVGSGALAASILVAELVLLVLATLAVRKAWLRWGPGVGAGYASADEARELLGVARLRRVRSVVRPDLARKGKR
ncbi:hypothetical protein EDD41_0555 [Luteococcus japonicus]|uniref:Conjugal transfer protein n=1 Tax=Luteococcus japonicus TaxID=33984 RepID=A0A3N1ZSQ0_9ACTN|nr:hypothetical protein [Luteococcus japonicus]ROR53407.1 hypothetical protein EDD41_0555 [Luteococcus japonicus]